MSQFCERQPDACAVGSQAAVALGQRAQAGAKMVYEFFNEHARPSETGSVTAAQAGAAEAVADTLTPRTAPAWRGPQPHRDARATARAGLARPAGRATR